MSPWIFNQPGQEMNWCIFYSRPWHVHCCQAAEGQGCSRRGGVWLGQEGVGGQTSPLRRDRSVGRDLQQHPSERQIELPRRTIMGHFVKRRLMYQGCAETHKSHHRSYCKSEHNLLLGTERYLEKPETLLSMRKRYYKWLLHFYTSLIRMSFFLFINTPPPLSHSLICTLIILINRKSG